MKRAHLELFTSVFVICNLTADPASHAQTVSALGVLPGSRASTPVAISSTGDVVVGDALTPDPRAFRWTASGGPLSLGVLPGHTSSFAGGVSADGSVVVGWSVGPDQRPHAFRWTAETGMVDLGIPLGALSAQAHAISGDGHVIAGQTNSASGTRAFRWTAETGMVSLGALQGGNFSSARASNHDGSVIVGASFNSGSHLRAFRWTVESGMSSLGVVASDAASLAYAVSSDGREIVGYSGNDAFECARAFRWTEQTGVQDLGLPSGGSGGCGARAYGVSGRGLYIVGSAGSSSAGPAFLWSQARGMMNLEQHLVSIGVGLDGWTFVSALAISADGRAITGVGHHNGVYGGWIVTLNCPADFGRDGAVTIQDVFDYLQAFVSAESSADFNGNDGVTMVDLFDFLDAWFAGC